MLRRSLQQTWRFLPALAEGMQQPLRASAPESSCIPAAFVRQRLRPASARMFSTDKTEKGAKEPEEPAATSAELPAEGEAGAAAEAAAEEAAVAPESEKDDLIAKQADEIVTLKDRLLRTLADMENLRERAARERESAHKFAVQGFVKDILDVPDNLERALESVRSAMYKDPGSKELAQGLEGDAGKALTLLTSFVEGVELTDRVMLQVFSRHGVERMSPLGDQFDPNQHEALFEVPDPTKEAGTVAHVLKVGYTLHGRVIRPAHVGVVKAPAA